MIARTSALAFGAAIVVAAPVYAAVLCTSRIGTGTVRIRTACKPNETKLDPIALGLQGPPGPSPGFTCTSTCISGFPSVQFTCGGTATSCTSPDGFQTAHARVVDCVTSDALATPFCLASACAAGPCPNQPMTPSCTADQATWHISGSISFDSNAPCRWVGPGGASFTCQISSTNQACRVGGYSFTVQPTASALVWQGHNGCDDSLPLVDAQGNLGNSVPVVQADVRYGTSGRLWQGDTDNSNHYVASGSFSAVGECP